MIELTAADGHKFFAYRADPPETPKGAVIVLQETPIVNPYIRKITDGFAENGYVAIAPALYERANKASQNGEKLEVAVFVKGAGIDGPLADIQAAVDSVKEAGKVAVAGYSGGGYLAYLSANLVCGLACAIGYYGPGIQDEYREKRKIPTLLHFAENDPLIPSEEVIQFRANRPDVSVYTYAAGHGFSGSEEESYDKDAASKALERTLFWISQYVVGQPPVTLKNAGAYALQKSDKKKKKKAGADDGPPMD
ncbi:MAG TPA: dienelactone hydrolase family protein [Methylocella sp.]|nr:dienelactone hydrolase family protein [Methylocella sp.]